MRFSPFAAAALLALVAAPSAAADPPKPAAELRLDPTRPGAPGRRLVWWLGFSPDGKALAARYKANTGDFVHVWNADGWASRGRRAVPGLPWGAEGHGPVCAFARGDRV